MPDVSVIIPTHDRAHLLSDALDSVFAQRGVDLEVIVVDDASKDATTELLAAWRGRAPGLRVVRLDANVGAAQARNLGIERATARWIAFQDSDDLWHPGKLTDQLEALARTPDAVLAFAPFLRRARGRSFATPGFDPRPGAPTFQRCLLGRNVIGTPTVVVATEVIRTVGGFDTSMRTLEDWECWLRIAERGRFVFTPKPVATARTQPGGVNDAGAAKRARALEYLMAKHGAAYAEAPTAEARVQFELGLQLLAAGEGTASRSAFARARTLRPDVRRFRFGPALARRSVRWLGVATRLGALPEPRCEDRP